MKNKTFKKSYNRLKNLSLDDLLEEISVIEEWIDQPENMIGWYAVVTDLGIVAYFGEESEAFKYRLDYINRILNS